MSGPVAMLQGLCIFPRDVQFDSGAKTLTRITETWLVGENASDGPTAVHMTGLWVGMGLRDVIQTFQVGFGTRDGSIPASWTTPTGTDDVEKALKKAFGQNSAKWRGFHLRVADLPNTGPTWDALFFKVVTKFQPNKPRDFHAVPVIVALAGGNEDIFGDSHYLLGLTVFTKSGSDVEDFLVVTHAMHYADGHPEIDIPPYRPASPPRKPRPRPKSTPVPPGAAKRTASKSSKSTPRPRRRGGR